MISLNNILVLDTALAGCSAGVVCEGGSAVKSEMMVRGQAEYLVPFANEVLKGCGLGYKHLDAVLCTVGPGAFTGLRIGLSAARAFGLSLEIPVFGVTTLQAVALDVQSKGMGAHSVILETKRRDFYAQNFSDKAEPLGDAVALELEALETFLPKGGVLFGDGVERFMSETHQEGWQVGERIDLPDLEVVADAFRKGGKEFAFMQNAEPLYLRGADVSQPKREPRRLEGVSQ